VTRHGKDGLLIMFECPKCGKPFPPDGRNWLHHVRECPVRINLQGTNMAVYTDEQVQRALSQDPSADAVHMLKSRGDVVSHMPLDEYIAVVEKNGFERVYYEEFDNRDGGKDALMMFFREPGQLLAFDTYCGQKFVNGGSVYYNWLPNDMENWIRHVSSGGFCDRGDGVLVWSGHHDCREALMFKLGQLEKHGTFVSPWVERAFLWLLHGMDYKVLGYDYKAINAARIAKLPEHVRTRITPGGPEDA
jgi:hypothetical protein